ncbi:chaperonin GroEL [Patescibacteria group bacterium]|nr:chaperonin GroEL [Patescibacteria group bacterium]
MAKDILLGEDARNALKSGVDQISNTIKITLGPRGRNVALDRGYGGPTITNDGVAIAREITLENKFENMGAEVIKEVASKTNDMAGDGTTTAVVLAQAIITEGLKKTSMGANPNIVRRGIEAAVKDVVKELKSRAKEVESKDEIRQIATISAESEEIGNEIADAINKVGKDGVVTVEESQTFGIKQEVAFGLELDKGYVSPYMITDTDRMEAEFKDVPILLTDKKITTVKEILPLLEKLAQSGKKDLVIIADDIEGEALATFVVNKLRGTFNVLAIKAPGYGDGKKEILEDIAIMVGATVISEEVGITFEKAELKMLGEASRVVSTKDNTVIVRRKGVNKQNVDNRVQQLLRQAKGATSKFDREKFEERAAKLSGGVAVIKVGAATETEMKYLKDKIEDAVNATKAAIEEGIVPGGGAALAHVSIKLLKNYKNNNTEFDIGYNILLRALVAPLKQIAENAGRDDGAVIVREVQKKGGNTGFDASKDGHEPRIVNMLNEGIIDPVKVTRSCVQNAASAAAVLLTTNAAVADKPEENKGGSMPAGGEMPGMGMM